MKRTLLKFAQPEFTTMFVKQFLPESEINTKNFRTELTYMTKVLQGIFTTKFNMRISSMHIFETFMALYYKLYVEEPLKLKAEKPYRDTNSNVIFISVAPEDILALENFLSKSLREDEGQLDTELATLIAAIDEFREANVAN